jgi:NAD(P)-dependent dehydrogenase (short-subunit alcohol dehydrogenase family)
MARAGFQNKQHSRGGAMPQNEVALIVGAGPNLSASLARLFSREGMAVALAARNAAKLAALVQETGARSYSCDASRAEEVSRLFEAVERDLGVPQLVVYNPSARVRGSIQELDPEEVERALRVSCFGGFLVAREAATRMLPRGAGTLLFTGASASVKGFAQSSAFAMGKFGLRGLAQALARELHPHNIHVGHVVIDGAIARPGDQSRGDRGPDGHLDPGEIAKSYLQLHRQQRSAWAWEIELRPWREKF